MHLRLSLPPQITCDPNLHTPTQTCRGSNNSPRDYWSYSVLEDCEREMGRRPTDCLERNKADEGCKGWVVEAPAREEASC